jgi:leader peptidase (prepilin peptidase)/N-methyltransferase
MDLPLFSEVFRVLEGDPWLWWWIIPILGLVIGSFLNVVIHRLPIMLEREWQAEARYFLGEETAAEQEERYNIAWPPSQCPACARRIRFKENIPLISWLILRARCPGCGKTISWRYPFIELLTGALFLVTFLFFGLSWELLAAWVFTAFLITASAIDADTTLLPDQLTLPLLWLGLLVNSFGTFTDLQSAVWGAVGGYLVLWLVYHGFRLLTGKEGMGYGDFKLLAALGAWMGWMMLPIIILLSATVAAIVGLLLILLLGRDRNLPIPFGPYLAAAGWVALVYGDSLLDFMVLR